MIHITKPATSAFAAGQFELNGLRVKEAAVGGAGTPSRA
jgi:hypothetical protein